MAYVVQNIIKVNNLPKVRKIFGLWRFFVGEALLNHISHYLCFVPESTSRPLGVHYLAKHHLFNLGKANLAVR